MFPKKNVFLFFLFTITCFTCFSQNFRTEWTVLAGDQITIPTNNSGGSLVYNYTVDWGDTSSNSGVTGNISHTYVAGGTYTVTISGDFYRIYFNDLANANAYTSKITSIEEWGSNHAWASMVRAFEGCTNLVNNASDTPVLTSATSLARMFYGASSIGGITDTGNWAWGTNTSTITNIAQMFRNATSFNKDISNWDVSSVTNMNQLFREAASFNQDIGGWTTTDLATLNTTFRGATSFNQDISGWTTTNLTSMNNTFRNATSFDQNIGGWDVSGVTSMNNIFNGATLSVNNYNALLIGWGSQITTAAVLDSNVDAGGSKYCSSAANIARNAIIAYLAGLTTPRTLIDGSVLADFTWTGTTDTDWSDFTNWLDGYDSDCNLDVTIPSVTNDPIIGSSTDVNIDDLTISSGASLTVSGSLTVNGNLITDDDFTINSGGSLIVSGTSTGKFSYKRSLANALKWYYVSPPVNGETINNYISNNSLQEGNGNTGLFYYDNNTTSGYLGTGYVFYTPTSTGGFIEGKGYGTKLSTPGDIIFTGTMHTSDVTIPLATAGSIDDSNLIGNPFPSYLPANENAVATNNLLTHNTAILSEETIWLWDNTISDYEVINNITASHYIPPGQGFFVDASSNTPDFEFLESWQSHQTTDVFYRNSDPVFRIKLNITNSSSQKKATQIFYYGDKTVGFDNGFDSTQIVDEGAALAIYSRLVGDHNSENLAIQTLPTIDLNTFVVPIGVKSQGQISFDTEILNKPSGIKIFLEDRYTNTFIQLENAVSHTINPDEEINGIGRFYLHLQSTSLSVEENVLKNVSIYNSNYKEITINGIPIGKADVSLYDILGKEIVKESFNIENETSKRLSLLHLKKGFYIVNLKTEKGPLTKKIILK